MYKLPVSYLFMAVVLQVTEMVGDRSISNHCCTLYDR